MNSAIAIVDEKTIEKFIDACNNDRVRVVALSLDIKDMNISIDQVIEKGENIKSDFNSLTKIVKNNEPCYFCFKMDFPKNKWNFVSWVPDDSKVKLKMTYSSAKGELKRKLGGPKFMKNDIFLSDIKDFDWDAITADDASLKELLMNEKERVIDEEGKSSQPELTKLNAMKTMNVKLTESAISAFSALSSEAETTAIFSINAKEELEAAPSFTSNFSKIGEKLPADKPRYVVYRYKHESPNGQGEIVSIVFVYFCPDDCTPREKMTYSMMSANIVSGLEALKLGKPKRLEFDNVKEFSDEGLFNELYPKKMETERFSRPKGPARRRGRGRRR